MSSLRGVCVQTGEHGHAPKYTLLSRRLRRFIYLLDSCPEPLARFSTGAESSLPSNTPPPLLPPPSAPVTPPPRPCPQGPKADGPELRACPAAALFLFHFIFIFLVVVAEYLSPFFPSALPWISPSSSFIIGAHSSTFRSFLWFSAPSPPLAPRSPAFPGPLPPEAPQHRLAAEIAELA